MRSTGNKSIFKMHVLLIKDEQEVQTAVDKTACVQCFRDQSKQEFSLVFQTPPNVFPCIVCQTHPPPPTPLPCRTPAPLGPSLHCALVFAQMHRHMLRHVLTHGALQSKSAFQIARSLHHARPHSWHGCHGDYAACLN